jgi:hypothetical protein
MIYNREDPVTIGTAIGKLLYKFYISTPSDLPNLPGFDRAAPGSDAYCVTTQDVYILDGDSGQWEVQ